MGTRRKPGLWHSARKVEIETVKKAHRKACHECGKLPSVRRLVITLGSGRHQTKEIYCIHCGFLWLQACRLELVRALKYLETGEGEIRD